MVYVWVLILLGMMLVLLGAAERKTAVVWAGVMSASASMWLLVVLLIVGVVR